MVTLAGNDELHGGNGKNRIEGNDGNEAHDGIRDLVDCGRGHDFAGVDQNDRVTRCERVPRS